MTRLADIRHLFTTSEGKRDWTALHELQLSCIMNVYLCRFLFFLFLWLPWWLPDEEEEAAFWGFRSWSVESTSSVSSWLGSFSWFWRSGEASLSVPLPASPETAHNRRTAFVSDSTDDWERKTFSTQLCLRIISKPTHVFHSCDPVFHRVHILPANQTVCSCISYSLAQLQMRNSQGMEKLQWGRDLLQLMWQMICWIGALLPWIFYSFYQSYCWSSYSICKSKSLYRLWQLRKLCKNPTFFSPICLKTIQAVWDKWLLYLLLIGEVSVPSSDDVAIHLSVF